MNTNRGKIQLHELQFILASDLHYGPNVESNLNNILEQREHDPSFLRLSNRFQLLPFKNERHRLLLYFWIKLGLPGYINDQQIDRQFWRRSSPDFWLIDFDIDIDELERFLLKQETLLPASLFPDSEKSTSISNSSRKTKMSSRNLELQEDAERMANEDIEAGLGYPTRRKIAQKLSRSSKWDGKVKCKNIERIIRNTWR